MSEAMMPTKSLFIYPGYRSVCVLAAMTVDTLDAVSKSYPQGKGYTHELICLVERRRLQVQAVCIDARQCTIVKHDNGVGVVRESLERQQCIVRLHYHIAFLRVGKDRVSLHQLLWKFVVQSLQHEGAKPRARPAGYRVQ
jgi:hypothetical protein